MADEETYNEFSGEEVHHHYHPQGPKRHHYPPHHTRIPADHLESHGNSKLWNDPDWGPMDAEATVPGLSAIGRGPKGDSISATVTSDDDSFVITIYDTDTGEVIGESSNLSAGYITAHQASVTPQPGKATTAYIDVHRGGEVYSYEIKINPGAPGTRIFILSDGIKQRSNRPAETTYACESEDLQCYNMPKFKNAPSPRPGDLVMTILEFLDGSYALALGTVMSNDHHRVIFLVQTILPTRTPHIETVDGVDWWFIGDVNTNVPATAGDIRDITIEMIGDEEEPYAYAEKNSDHTISLYFFLPKSHEYQAGENLELEDYTFDIKEEYTNSVLAQALEAAGNLYSGGDGISIDSDHVIIADDTIARSDDVESAISEASDKLQSEIDDLQNTVDTLEDNDTTYTAGDYIEITGEENAISASLAVTAANEYTDTKAEELQEEIANFNPGEIYTAGNMIDITDNVISVDNIALSDYIQTTIWNLHYMVVSIEWNDNWPTSVVPTDMSDNRPESVTFTVTNKTTGVLVYSHKLTEENNWCDSFLWAIGNDEDYEYSLDKESSILNYRFDCKITDQNIVFTGTYIFDNYYICYDPNIKSYYFTGDWYSEGVTPDEIKILYPIDLEANYNYSNENYPPWYQDIADATSIIIDSTFAGAQPISISGWFATTNIENPVTTLIDVFFLDTSKCTDMNYAFYGQQNNLLSIAGLDAWNVSNVTNMNSMFEKTHLVPGDIQISNWDVSNVTNMRRMFAYADATGVDPKFFALTINSKRDQTYMFYCSKFSTLDLSNWDIVEIDSPNKIIQHLFNYADQLETIYASNWSEKITNLDYNMFTNCPKLIGGNGTTWDEDHVTAAYAHIDTEDNPGYFTEKTLDN